MLVALNNGTEDDCDLNLSDGSQVPMGVAQDLCTAEPKCGGFFVAPDVPRPTAYSGSKLYTREVQVDTDVYLGYDTTILPQAVCKLEEAVGCNVQNPDAWLVCESGDGIYENVIASYQLPPNLIAKSCRLNPLCVGFRVSQNAGDLFGYPYNGDTSYIAVPRTQPRHETPSRGLHVLSLPQQVHDFPGYAEIADWAGLTKSIGMANGTEFNLDITLSNGSHPPLGTLLDLCAADPSCNAAYRCDATANRLYQRSVNTSYDLYAAFNKTKPLEPGSYQCSFVKGGCHTPSPVWLECPGDWQFDVIIASYALPPFLIAKACDENPKCVAFRVRKDQTAGDLFGQSHHCTTYFSGIV